MNAGPSPRPLRILLISQWFDPEPTFKGLLFAKELVRQGHDVEVLTGFPNYPGGRLYEGYRLRPISRELVDGIRVTRVAVYPSHDASAIRRVWNYLSFALSGAIGALTVRRPDVAYVYHPPATAALPALVLKLFRGVPFVYDIQDLWPDSLEATGMVRSKRVLDVVAWGMGRIHRHAARITVLSDGFRRVLTERGVPDRKIVTIPNWTDEAQLSADAHPVSSRAERGMRADGPERFRVTFAGNVGTVQALHVLVDAAQLLRDRDDIVFTIVGDGLDLPRVRALAAAADLDNLEFRARVPMHEMRPILEEADALLVTLRDDPLFEVTIPSKTGAYLFAGRPLLMGVRGSAADLVRAADAGACFEPGDAASLAAAVEHVADLSEAERAAMGDRGRKYYDEHLSVTTGARRFSDTLRRASLSRPHSSAVKRVVDVLGAALLLVVTALPAVVVAGVVRRGLGAPVFFRQTRPGRHGRPFTMLKFRTMTDRLGPDGELLSDGDRLTPLGATLRSSSLDELPELWNVLRGDMSLVGPRPLLMRYTEHFSEEESERLLVRPGITGWAQVNGRNTASWNDRLALDVWYVRNRSLLLDIRILFRTAASVVSRRGVEVDPGSVMRNLDDERRADGMA